VGRQPWTLLQTSLSGQEAEAAERAGKVQQSLEQFRAALVADTEAAEAEQPRQ
jgi:hypothetical protein